MYKIYVYGTLRKGGELSHYLRGNEKLQTIKLPGFKMYSLGLFPAVTTSDNIEDTITVEEYIIDEYLLKILDRVEGHPGFYERIFLNDHYIYLYPHAIEEQFRVKDGDWFNK